jgi:hypothetical protein
MTLITDIGKLVSVSAVAAQSIRHRRMNSTGVQPYRWRNILVAYAGCTPAIVPTSCIDSGSRQRS